MTAAQNPGPGPASDDPDDVALRAYADRLADAVDASLEDWVVHCVEVRASDAGIEVDDELRVAARVAGVRCRDEVGTRVRELLGRDIDEQPTTPLTILRGAVEYPTAVLRERGVSPSRREEFAETNFPDDVYDLGPATFDDISPALGDPGLRWGAAKAHVHLKRRRAAGQR